MKTILLAVGIIVLVAGLALWREFCAFVDDVCDIHIDEE